MRGSPADEVVDALVLRVAPFCVMFASGEGLVSLLEWGDANNC